MTQPDVNTSAKPNSQAPLTRRLRLPHNVFKLALFCFFVLLAGEKMESYVLLPGPEDGTAALFTSPRQSSFVLGTASLLGMLGGRSFTIEVTIIIRRWKVQYAHFLLNSFFSSLL
jgi:hypothetical protein